MVGDIIALILFALLAALLVWFTCITRNRIRYRVQQYRRRQMARFTASHMSEVAIVLKDRRPMGSDVCHDDWEAIVDRFVIMFRGSNASFKETQFREECGQ